MLILFLLLSIVIDHPLNNHLPLVLDTQLTHFVCLSPTVLEQPFCQVLPSTLWFEFAKLYGASALDEIDKRCVRVLDCQCLPIESYLPLFNLFLVGLLN